MIRRFRMLYKNLKRSRDENNFLRATNRALMCKIRRFSAMALETLTVEMDREKKHKEQMHEDWQHNDGPEWLASE